MEEKEKTTFNSSAILDVNTMFVDPTALDFKLMHQVYVAKQNGQESGISNPEKEEEYLKLAHIWIDAYSQATGRPNSGEIAFTNCIDEYGFQVAMEVAQNMRGYKIEKVRDVLVATFGSDNPLASEVIVRFIMHPKIASMFEIYSYHTSAELEAKHEKDKILAGGEERKKAILQEYFAAISREPIVAQTLEEVEEAKPQKESTTSVIPALTFADFSPKKMFEYKDLLEYENGKVVIIGPNGERVIDENPDDNKIAYLNEIWEATCWEVEQMMSQPQETPNINSTIPNEKENKIILQNNPIASQEKSFVKSQPQETPNINSTIPNEKENKIILQNNPTASQEKSFVKSQPQETPNINSTVPNEKENKIILQNNPIASQEKSFVMSQPQDTLSYILQKNAKTSQRRSFMMSLSQKTSNINSGDLFGGDNQIVLDKLFEMFQGDRPINNVNVILTTLAQIDGIEDVVSSIIKADKFLTYLKFYGEMDLDFKGCHQTEYYIEMARAHQQAPAMEMEREF